jgi:ketosteroid isomerase-like protein
MTTSELANELVTLCRVGRFHDAIKTLYSPDVVSVEAMPGPDGSREVKGLPAVLGKGEWWVNNHEVHSGTVEGPMVSGDHFAVRFVFDVTFKPTGKRHTMDELAVYQVKDGKVVREEFFYSVG